MDINFPLVLVLLVLISGTIWLLDALVLARLRDKKSVAGTAKDPVYVEYSKSFFPVLFIVLILRSFIVEPFQIPSPSMVPTLQVGDFILVNKFIYGLRLPVARTKVLDITKPKRGDVMVFFPPNEKRYFIKRVVGLPGDKIIYKNNKLFVNGEKVKETLLATLPSSRPFYQLYEEELGDSVHQTRKILNPLSHGPDTSYIVPEGHYYMMGDNRNNSSDSRVWKSVPEENIVGKAFAIWMHWESLLSLPSFSRVGSIK
ncbi:signal peptidase I [Candidatus Endobugula sertula]|uniref:Signal peptidase I n=1 Tax=Candidatus Endobugula sertula TaxID=62101 RepID=A0A1D2QN68_9GAMM|nr:signal peptidase I [Candidatus Endobugula sertula]